ncbi:MAG: ABC transporter ATP-binding protein [Deltaproteobacteria bacterium]|nr:ABC transporter ATP-binding protein [Deltaproteobacteria bacterium]
MIELKNLTKRYGNTLAVDGINLSIARGEIFGFIGPNGAGKTTTIRMLGGILSPTSGSVMIDGVNMAENPVAAKKRIGFIPDRPYLYEKLTGREFMRFTADIYGVAENVFLEKSQELLQTFNIHHWADELVEAYSHGMKQRLIIAAALLHEPKVIIIDEPMVGLDPSAIKLVKDMMRREVQKGTTIFMSTHTLAIAEDLCDRIGIIHRGRILAQGTTNDLKLAAQAQEADLEEVFLRLTTENSNTLKK